jgi:hypothetical protein
LRVLFSDNKVTEDVFAKVLKLGPHRENHSVVTRISWGEKLDSCLEVVIGSNILRKFFAIYLSVCASDLFEFKEQAALRDKTFASVFKGPVLSDLGTGSDNKLSEKDSLMNTVSSGSFF